MKGFSLKLCIISCLALVSGVLFTTCEKPERIVKLSTIDAVEADISYTSVKLKGEVTDLGSKAIEDHGILLSENSTPRVGNARVESLGPLNSKGIFQVQVTGLTKNTTYYFRAFVTVDGVDIYADKITSFKTKDTQAATVTAGAISNITKTTANLDGEVTADGGETVIKRGLVWGATAGPTVTNCLDSTVNGSGTGTFTGFIHGLTSGTTYYARTYAINAKGIGYNSADIVFTTHSLPSAVTNAANPVLNTTATLNGTVNANSLSTIVTFEYGTTTSYGQSATATQSPVTGSAVTNVSAIITGLSEGVTYNFRVNAISVAGPVNGDNMTFKTLETPTAETKPASSVTSSSATLNGLVNPKNSPTTVTFEYGPTTSYGTTVTASQSPVTGNSATPVTYNLTGLTPGATYHFRVRASSAGGQADGVDQPFTLLLPPEAMTGTADNITPTAAMLHGTINARNSSTTVTFEYGTTTSYGTIVTATQSPVTGNIVTDVSATISGLSPSTTYHFRVVGTSTGGAGIGNDASFLTNEASPTITDIDGNVYNIIQIGTQTWLKENLKTTTYNNGVPITFGTDELWAGIRTEAYCWYLNDINNKAVYGGLYNWYAVSDVRNICPIGWHVPTYSDWESLVLSLGGPSVAGGKLKETGLTHWISPNTGATNESGFNALPGGGHSVNNGNYFDFGYYGDFWTSTEFDGFNSYLRRLYFESTSVIDGALQKPNGFSVRCLKGELSLVETLAPTAIASSTSTLNGKVNPNGASTTVTFEYGTTTAYGTEVAATQSPITGSVPVNASANLTGLTSGTTYHYRVKALNSGGTSYGGDMIFTTYNSDAIADIDGNNYNIVTIGSQVWMAENLKTTKYNDGTVIPNLTDKIAWDNNNTGAYCDYDNIPSNSVTYGRLYNWFVGASTNPKNVCPTAWHVPSDAEWITMRDFLGGSTVAGGKLKEIGTTHWQNPNAGATNELGFIALPSGNRQQDGSGTFSHLGLYGFWWTSTVVNFGYANYYMISYDLTDLSRGGYSKWYGYSIRCLKN